MRSAWRWKCRRRERVQRWSRLMEGVERNDVRAWRDDFVAALAGARDRRAPEGERPVRGAIAADDARSDDLFTGRDETAPLAHGRDSAAARAGWRTLGRG